MVLRRKIKGPRKGEVLGYTVYICGGDFPKMVGKTPTLSMGKLLLNMMSTWGSKWGEHPPFKEIPM